MRVQQNMELLGDYLNGFHARGVHVRTHVCFYPDSDICLKRGVEQASQCRFTLNPFLKVGV
jgi:hypothetical protein